MRLETTIRKDEYICFVFDKDEAIFPFLGKFLINCGLTKNPYVDEYQEQAPNIHAVRYKFDRYKNDDYDVIILFDLMNVWLLIKTIYNQNVVSYVLEGMPKEELASVSHEQQLEASMST